MPDLRILLTERPDLVLTIDDDFIGSAYSPQVEVVAIEGGHSVTITHKGPDGLVTDSFDVMDGVSPTVDITSTTERHTITITDAQGPHVYEVDTYADEERARATAESGRASAESARVAAESARVNAENERSTAESARDEAESVRSAEEATRAENEGIRVTNETARANAEIARDAAEQAREQAETSREAAWVTLSEQATSATQAANNAAQTASQAASAANSAAQSASQAESTMTANETARASAEQGRVAAEQGRVTAETSRVSAETARATEWAEIESDAQSAIDAAQDATADATAAAAEARAASAATWLSGNVLFGELSEAAVLIADDAYAAPAKSVEVFGVSTQDGTPTPDAPVPIKSVDDLTLVFAGKNLFDVDHVHALLLSAATYSVSDDSITVTKTAQSAACVILVELPAIVGTSVTYTLAANTTSSGAMLCLGYCDSNGSNRTQIERTNAMKNPVITASLNVPAGKVAAAWLYPDFASTTISSCVFSNIQLEVGTTATAYTPYVGQSVEIPLSNNKGRSLPDGTRDTLTLSYQGPSTEHEGWGVFSKTLTQNLGDWTILGTETAYNAVDLGNCWRFNIARSGFAARKADAAVLCTKLPAATGWATDTPHIFSNNTSLWAYVESDTLADAIASLANAEVIYPLATPITHDLGTVELPILPNPLTAWADGGSAQPTMSMEYEQDINIVIGRLRDAIADMATS